jgi:predicted ATPase with chaperone activity
MPTLGDLIADNRVHVLDGAMGTMLYNRGVFVNVCYDELSLSQPALVQEVHEAYVQAGAEILETNTFGANPVKLSSYGLDDDTELINRSAAVLARQAARGRALVVGAIGLVATRPFRAPHHTISPSGLVGGGIHPGPGEASLAHHGVLFLDELTEFRRDAVEGLRQPLEDGRVIITRAVGSVEFPARFTLVAAANPCPCGFDGDGVKQCVCRPDRVQLYRNKLSGPLLDRIDIRLRIPRLTKEELLGSSPGEASEVARTRVEEARDRQRRRWVSLGVACNAHLPGPVARRTCSMSAEAEGLLTKAVETLALTGRGFDRAIKVGRTVADLAGSERVETDHLAEALSYRTGFGPEVLARAG